MESGYPVDAKLAELERTSVYQLRLKAVEMLRSRTRLVKSHGDELGLEYLWNGDEYGSLENGLKAMEENAEYGGQPEILALVHVVERPITVHYEDSDKGTVFGEFFTDRPSIDILYYPEEHDDKRELVKAGHYLLLRSATLLSQPENGKVCSLGDYVAVRSETIDWFMCVISDVNDPSKEVKVRFMRKSGQYFLLSKKLEKWFPKSAIFHICHTIHIYIPSVPSTDNRLRNSFDAIDIKSICDKMKTYTK